MKKYIFIIIFIIVFINCTPYREFNAIKNLQYSIESVELKLNDYFNFGIILNIGIYNPNNTDVKITYLEYKVRINDYDMANGVGNEEITIKKKDKTVYKTLIRLNMDNYLKLLDVDDYILTIDGKITFKTSLGKHTFPFSVKRKLIDKEL